MLIFSLQQLHSDLLFSVRMGQRETLLYLLFEHQSSPELEKNAMSVAEKLKVEGRV